jgi:alcohol dehydrogenase class IV
MRFDFATARRILFGPGTARDLVPAARSSGKRALLVTGATPDRVTPLAAGLDTVVFPVRGEPDLECVREGVRQVRKERCDMVIAIGGGSALDAGKAIAALTANSGEPLDYLEVIGHGRPLENAPLPFLAVPTTAGTGSEATRNAVLGSAEHRVKASLRSASMLPRVALVDPELMLDLPRPITASTGLDALTQLIEPYVCSRATPMTDALCVDGIRRVAASLRRACEDGDDPDARTEMSLASLYGGIALTNAGLGAVHGFAAPIGGMFPAPHGAVCAALLPHAMRANVAALEQRAAGGEALQRFAIVGSLVTGLSAATAADGIAWVTELVRDLEIPPLRSYGIGDGDIQELAEKAGRASSMKANPVVLTAGELEEILRAALG